MALRVAVLLAALACVPAAAGAQDARNVLLVLNENSPQSVLIGAHYAKVRQLPDHNVVRLKARDEESVARAEYEATIEAPIAQWLTRHLLQDQVLYIVLTKGVPLRVQGTGTIAGTVASVDSELTLLYRKMIGLRVTVGGRIDNPLFLRDRPIAEAQRFTRVDSDVYLVTRLDGFTADDVVRMIDRGMAPAREGRVVLDQRATLIDRGGDAWLAAAADRLKSTDPDRVVLESTRALAEAEGPILGYFSWGSNDPANQRRQMGLSFANGAIGGMFVSTDGRTFREPPETWKPAVAGSSTGGQSLVGDLIREGITGVSGHVEEPFLDAIIRPQVLFPLYFSGFNLAESFYLAMPFLSWQDLVIGDPLVAPFAGDPLPQDRLHKGLDDSTGLPAVFAERRLASLLKSAGLSPAGLKLAMKAQSYQDQGKPEAEVEVLLVAATKAEPKLVGAQLQLAMAAEARGDRDEAIGRYRAVLAADPNHVVALNNLAYSIAEYKKAPKDALPLAQRAYQLSKQAAVIADTLGWIHYLLGDKAAARPLLDRAAQGAPGNVDILVHAATVHADLNNLAQARSLLDAALKADPKAADRADVKALTARIR